MVSNSLLSSSSTLPPHISRGVGPVTVVHLSVQSHVSGPPPFLYRLRSLERNTILPRPYQVHDFGPCCRYGLARSCYRQDGPCNARRNQPAGLFSQFVTPSKFWLLPSPNMKMRRAPKLQVLSVADFTLAIGRTICHGSDSVENAEKEIKLGFFFSLVQCARGRSVLCLLFIFFAAGSRRASFSTRPRSPPGSSNRREVFGHHGGGIFFTRQYTIQRQKKNFLSRTFQRVRATIPCFAWEKLHSEHA